MGGRGQRHSRRAFTALSVLFAISILFFCATSAAAGDGPRVVYVDTAYWKTDLLAIGYGPAATVDVSNCAIGPAPQLKVARGQSAIFKDFAGYLCEPGPAGLVEARADGAVVYMSAVRESDPANGRYAMFTIPPLTDFLPGSSRLVAELIQSDDAFDTSLILFNEGTDPAWLTAVVYDGDGVAVGSELLEVPGAGGRNFYLHQLTTKTPIGRVDLRYGIPFGCPTCSATPRIYGFVMVNWRIGGSPRIAPLHAVRFISK